MHIQVEEKIKTYTLILIKLSEKQQKNDNFPDPQLKVGN